MPRWDSTPFRTWSPALLTTSAFKLWAPTSEQVITLMETSLPHYQKVKKTIMQCFASPALMANLSEFTFIEWYTEQNQDSGVYYVNIKFGVISQCVVLSLCEALWTNIAIVSLYFIFCSSLSSPLRESQAGVCSTVVDWSELEGACGHQWDHHPVHTVCHQQQWREHK